MEPPPRRAAVGLGEPVEQSPEAETGSREPSAYVRITNEAVKAMRDEVNSLADYLIDQARHRLDRSQPAAAIPAEVLHLVMRSPHVELADIELAIERFLRQNQVLAHAAAGVPALMPAGADPIPVDIGLPQFDVAHAAYWADSERLGGFFESLPFGASLIAPEDADRAFGYRLALLLTERLSASPSPSPEAETPAPPGYLFTVVTKTAGLRVHYSRALFVDLNQVFSSPTTPVSRYLGPGCYVFGVYGQGCPTGGYWNGAEYRVPSPPMNSAFIDI